MTKEQKVIKRYSISFKQKVVREVEEGELTISEVGRRYGIKGGSTIQNWIRKFGKNYLLSKIVRIETMGEKDRIKELEGEVMRLKVALADATLARHALESLIDVVNEHYHTDVKKNLGGKPSKNVIRKKDVQ